MFRTDFIITASADGHIKFWKKAKEGIEFVKHFKAHLGAIVQLQASNDGLLLATIGKDNALKIFDVINFGEFYLLLLCFRSWLIVGRYDQSAEASVYATLLLLDL